MFFRYNSQLNENAPIYYMQHTWGEPVYGRSSLIPTMREEDPVGTVSDLIQIAEDAIEKGQLEWMCHDMDISEKGCPHCFEVQDIEDGTIIPPIGYVSKAVRPEQITSHCRIIVSESTGTYDQPEHFVLIRKSEQ